MTAHPVDSVRANLRLIAAARSYFTAPAGLPVAEKGRLFRELEAAFDAYEALSEETSA